MSKQPTQEQLQKQVDDFNEKHPVGSTITLCKAGRDIEVVVSAPASILGNHSAVGWFKGIRGCYSLDFAL